MLLRDVSAEDSEAIAELVTDFTHLAASDPAHQYTNR
jgi:hypothetical protein